MWSAALGLLSTVKDMAQLYQEQVASQVVVQAQAVPLSRRDVYKMAAPAGRTWRKHLHLHVRTDSSTLWHLLDKALQVKHPRTVAHKPTVRMQLRLMNGLRSDSAAWAVCRWYRRAAGSVEDRLVKILKEIQEEVVDVTADLRRGGAHGRSGPTKHQEHK